MPGTERQGKGSNASLRSGCHQRWERPLAIGNYGADEIFME